MRGDSIYKLDFKSDTRRSLLPEGEEHTGVGAQKERKRPSGAAGSPLKCSRHLANEIYRALPGYQVTRFHLRFPHDS